ncbi:LysM peptidoglycan-binding domain-containing protein [Streptomyces sp. NPDC059835]|uniref:LysM peptidoglycan-binding domain-containing protein n=1 Tax=Streptomyces sp. NPDC059835 TaxID=3346967 RepID=UPI0036507CEF
MPNTPRPRTPRPGRRTGGQTAAAVLRGLLSLTVLLALLGGLPALLWWATSTVGPAGMAALGSLLSTDDSGQVFLLALAAAGWIGWLLFAIAVVLEIPAQLRGRAVPQIRGLVGQRAAAALVGAVLLALPTGTALAAPASATPTTLTAPGISAAAVPGSAATSTAVGAAVSSESSSAPVTYTVRDTRPAESLWSIAETTLGDGQRWEEIATLNKGHVMADGLTFHTDRPIQPGWALRLPDDARPPQHDTSAGQASGAAAQQSGSPNSAAAVYTVREGDSLTGIAAEHLGDADRYLEIFHLNQGSPLPDGGTFTDPDLIHPGQHLTLPPPATATPQPAETTPTPAAPAPAPAPVTATPTPAKDTQPSISPAPPESPKPSTAPAPAGSGAATPQAPSTSPTSPPQAQSSTPAATAPAPAATAGAPSSAGTASPSSINWALVAGIGTLLAASLAGALGVRRILQQRHRRAGETIAQDETPTDLEQLLAAGAQPAGVELLDHVLRTLAHHATDPDTGSQVLPALRGARLGPDGVVLLLDEPANPIAPFAEGPDARTWVLDPGAGLLDGEDLAGVLAPYPGLVTLGTDDEGLVLVDLMTCRVLLLDGSGEEVLAVARALALELGSCAWTDYSEILTTGLGTRLAGLLPQGRIRTMPHLPAVAADLGELMLEAHQSGKQLLPWLLVGAGDHADNDVVQLADALSAARDLAAAIVLPATPATRRCFPHAEVLTITEDDTTTVDALATAVELQRVSDEQYRQYVHALTVATQEAEPATLPWELAEDHRQPAATGQPLAVRVTSTQAADPGNPFPALLAGLAPASPEAVDDNPQTPTGTPHTQPTPGEALTPTPIPPARTSDTGTGTGTGTGTEDDAVRIDMLGALRISGGLGTPHSPRTAALAALLHLRPGRSAEYLCKAMDPINPWSVRTLHSRLSELRNTIGLTDDGYPRLPRPKDGAGYAFHPTVTSDWELFQHLATRGLAAGPEHGIPDLETAMGLVRGKPFDGRTLPWADPVIQDMLSRITDIAHTLARWHTDGDTPDLDAARHTIQQALDIEETSEVLYRDLLHIEWAADNQTAIRKTIARLQHMARTYDITLDDLTEDTINLVLSGRPSPTTLKAATT